MKKIITLCMLTAASVSSFGQTFNTQRIDMLLNILEQKDKYMGSIAVSQNGHLLYSRAIGYSDIATSKQATTDTRYRIGSISKMFTAALIMRAVEEKKITLAQTLDKYYPQIPNAGKINIRELLTHRSGIHNFTNDSIYWTYYTQPKTEKEMMQLITASPSDFEPGTKLEYSNSNYVILTFILEKLYGKPYAELLQTRIAQPQGLKNTYFGGKINTANNECYSYFHNDKWTLAPETSSTITQGAGALVSTPTDLTIFIEKLFNGSIVSKNTLDTMMVMHDKFGIGMIQVPYFEKYGYGHTGGVDGFQSAVYYFPDEKLSVAIEGNGVDYPNNDILLCALSCYYNRDFNIPTFTSFTPAVATLDQYTGNYTSTALPLKIQVSRQGTRLLAQASGQQPFMLEAVSATTFHFDMAGIVLEFDAAKKQMILKQGGKEYIYVKE
ncbi:beta-lactamase family protein [Chitinophaga sp. Cy-1792]|nr:beta-lactamase family protein [Chitinophaga sp. Cy-1792]